MDHPGKRRNRYWTCQCCGCQNDFEDWDQESNCWNCDADQMGEGCRLNEVKTEEDVG